MSRKFTATKAKRERVPMLVGLTGASGSGKTYSALRLATGMAKVTGGEIFFLDTESRRALHYADDFEFQHVPMDAPFSPLDYLEALKFCAADRDSIVIVDSLSHEHEGPGGVLEMHETELDRMAGNDSAKRNRMTFSAWAKPKAQRRKLINEVLRMGVNAIFCFRAKEKLKLVTGKDPINRGWQPIAGEEFVFEMTVNVLLYPGSGGVPEWHPEMAGERVMTKLPENLAGLFFDGKPLSEETGEGLARWAAGKLENKGDLSVIIEWLELAKDRKAINETVLHAKRFEWSDEENSNIRETVKRRRKELATPAKEMTHAEADAALAAEDANG